MSSGGVCPGSAEPCARFSRPSPASGSSCSGSDQSRATMNSERTPAFLNGRSFRGGRRRDRARLEPRREHVSFLRTTGAYIRAGRGRSRPRATAVRNGVSRAPCLPLVTRGGLGAHSSATIAKTWAFPPLAENEPTRAPDLPDCVGRPLASENGRRCARDLSEESNLEVLVRRVEQTELDWLHAVRLEVLSDSPGSFGSTYAAEVERDRRVGGRG